MAYFLPSLCRDDHVELVRPVDGRREASCLAVVGGADVRDDAVEHHRGAIGHRADVLRQTDEERDPRRRRCSNGGDTWQTICED